MNQTGYPFTYTTTFSWVYLCKASKNVIVKEKSLLKKSCCLDMDMVNLYYKKSGKTNEVNSDMNILQSHTALNREEWAKLRNKTPLLLSKNELENVKGTNDIISLQEVEEIYLPLSRLINLKVEASRQWKAVTCSFLDEKPKKVPFVIGVAGSVAVGKSTTARVLRTLLSRWESHKKVDLVTTDGFLYSTDTLEKKGLMSRKGFPESYDTQKLIDFMVRVKSGVDKVEAPVYSHLTYDIVPDKAEIIRNPDILIVEGINVLQVKNSNPLFVSDFFDFSIYLDAEESDIKQWYIERFFLLQKTAFEDKQSYFHRYKDFSQKEAMEKATEIWADINAKNLKENILPTMRRADLILRKNHDHEIEKVYLKKF